jgi:hypothetical protein
MNFGNAINLVIIRICIAFWSGCLRQKAIFNRNLSLTSAQPLAKKKAYASHLEGTYEICLSVALSATRILLMEKVRGYPPRYV